MSLRLLRTQRYFGELHQIFATKPIYPDEPVKPVSFSIGASSAKGMRDRRLHLLLKRDKMNASLKQYIYGINENNKVFEEPQEVLRDDLTETQRINKILSFFNLKMDLDTKLISGMGFDSMIKVAKEKNMTEKNQDKLRDIWINLGFYSPEKVISAVPGIELGDSAEKINRRIYTNRHKITPPPYKGIFNERDPRSEVLDLEEPEFFSASSEDIEEENLGLIGLKKAKEKYAEQIHQNGDIDSDVFTGGSSQYENDSKADKMDDIFDKIKPINPIKARTFLKSLNMRDSNIINHNIKTAGRLTKKLLKDSLQPTFKMMDKDDYLKQVDMEYHVNKTYGPVPSFAEIVAEAEEIILNSPEAYKVYLVDEYKKNVHFEPRYLGKEVSVEEYHWSFMPKREEALFPGFLTGKYPFRQSPNVLKNFESIVNSHDSKGYFPEKKDLSRKSLSLMKKDPSHEHYLKNHLMMWIDDYRKFINFGGFGNQHKTIPMVPWEYLKLQKPNQLKVKRESKVAIDEEGYVSSTGKRKTARAKASVRNGTGIITINGKSMVHYCPDLISRDRIVRPLMISKLVGLIDVKAEVHGGGFMGQSFALRQAISKALIRYIPECSKIICSSGLIERDPRQVERKKTSKHKARKSYTFVKR